MTAVSDSTHSECTLREAAGLHASRDCMLRTCAKHSVPSEACARFLYMLGQAAPAPSFGSIMLSRAQLALIGYALEFRQGPCTTRVSMPWTFVYNGTNTAALSGCLPNVEAQCCEDIRSVYHICHLAGVPPGTTFLMITGDTKPHNWWPHELLPVFSGNRHVGGGGIVLPMQSLRFFEDVTINRHDSPVPFEQKRDALMWRGDSTGFEPGQSLQRPRYVHALRQRGHDGAHSPLLALSSRPNQFHAPQSALERELSAN